MNTYNKFAVITGASDGIGLQLAKQFAAHNYDLLIVADSDKIHAAKEQLNEYDVNIITVKQNLATFDGVEALWQKIRETGRPVNAVALNAGIGAYGKFHEIDLQKHLELINLNVTGTVQLAKYITQEMVTRGEGKILITSSMVGDMPSPYTAVYAASKAFLYSFSESLHQELKESGIKVTALRPDATDTNFFKRAGMQESKIAQGDKADPALVAKQGFEALMNGDDAVVGGGAKSKMMAAGGKLMPETMKTKVMENMTEPKKQAR